VHPQRVAVMKHEPAGGLPSRNFSQLLTALLFVACGYPPLLLQAAQTVCRFEARPG